MSDSKCLARQFNGAFLDGLSAEAAKSPRLRQHFNIHRSYDDPCQRFFNAVEPGSYLRPTRHAVVPKSKLLVALRGKFALVLFDCRGEVVEVVPFGASASADEAMMVEVEPAMWNTTLALVPSSVLLEIKAGPFDPLIAPEGAPWAPVEGSTAAREYAKWLTSVVAHL